MSQTELPIESLPIWSRFNGVTFEGVRISQIEGKGFGLVSERIFQPPPDERTPNHRILSVPTELVLNAEAVEEYAKEDQRFRELLNAAGGQVMSPKRVLTRRETMFVVSEYLMILTCSYISVQSPRGSVLLFLLAQLILIWKSEKNTGLSNPWTQYIKYLPRTVPLPTMWTDAERALLNGTSLEVPAIFFVLVLK